jgi:hypothetical protein
VSKKKYAGAAEKQAAYRARHRNAHVPTDTPIRRKKVGVTVDPRFADPHLMYIGDFGYGPLFATVIVRDEDSTRF